MKRFLTIAVALALVLGLSQCRKPNAPTINGLGTTHVVLQASFDNGNSKIAQDGTGLKWEDGENADKIVVKQGTTELGTLTCTNAANGTFVGEIAETTGEITFTFGTENFMNQTGKLNNAIYLTSGDVSYEPSGSYNSVEMKMSQTTAILKLDLSYLGSTTKADDGATVTVKVDDNAIAQITNVKSSSTEMYVALPITYPNAEKAYVFSSTNGKNLTFTWTLDGNTFFTAGTTGGGSIKPVETDEWVNFNDPKMGVSGLPIWAKYNVGANVDRILNDFEHAVAADWYGGYYQWGRATTTDNYAWTNCPHTNGEFKPKNKNVFTKYVPEAVASTYGYNNFYDNETVLDDNEDPAYVSTSGEWRSPTKEELAQLKENTYFQWTNDYNGKGLKGYIVYMVKDESHKNCITGYSTDHWFTKNGTENTEYYVGQENPFSYTTSNPHLFLPAAGYRLYANVPSPGSSGYYKSRSINTDEPNLHWAMYFTKSSIQPQKGSGRHAGYSIRAVRNVSGK